MSWSELQGQVHDSGALLRTLHRPRPDALLLLHSILAERLLGVAQRCIESGPAFAPLGERLAAEAQATADPYFAYALVLTRRYGAVLA